jgi:hypothetical protein
MYFQQRRKCRKKAILKNADPPFLLLTLLWRHAQYLIVLPLPIHYFEPSLPPHKNLFPAAPVLCGGAGWFVKVQISLVH